ncbi:hypothetical protein [Ornithinimicrobium sp. W1665]
MSRWVGSRGSAISTSSELRVPSSRIGRRRAQRSRTTSSSGCPYTRA